MKKQKAKTDEQELKSDLLRSQRMEVEEAEARTKELVEKSLKKNQPPKKS